MVTSPDRPPIPHNHEKIDNKADESANFVSSKSTRKIDRAVKKMRALKEDTSKYNPQAIFLDPDNNEQDKQAQTKAIQLEQQRLEREQANLISITPAPQHTPQVELTKTHSREKNSQSKDGRHKQQQYTGHTRTNHTRCEHKKHERQ